MLRPWFQEKHDEEQKQLGMKNMLGAFVVLGGGCLVGLFISALDMLWGVFKRTVKYGVSRTLRPRVQNKQIFNVVS